MANPDEGNIIVRIMRYTGSVVIDGLSLVNPQNIKSVFSDMNPLPSGFLRLYLFIIALPLLAGYFLFFSEFRATQLPTEDSVKLAVMYYVTAALLPMLMAYLLYLFDVRLVGTRVTHDEALTLFTYALTPGILSGIFKTNEVTLILHIIGMMYSVYLIHEALERKYGQDRSIMISFIFLVISGMFSGLAVMLVLKAVLWIPGYYW